MQNSYYRRTYLVTHSACTIRLIMRSTRLTIGSTTRFPIRSTRLSTRSTHLPIRLSICSNRLSTCSSCALVVLVVLSVGLFVTDHK